LKQIDDIKIAAPCRKLIPLAQLARTITHEGSVSIWRESPSRRISVAINVRGPDMGSFVAAAQKALAEQIEMPHGCSLEWGGQYENLQRASHRLMMLVPVSLLLTCRDGRWMG
jgi:cobalt-zinc-cadmium resistance protein CzcA